MGDMIAVVNRLYKQNMPATQLPKSMALVVSNDNGYLVIDMGGDSTLDVPIPERFTWKQVYDLMRRRYRESQGLYDIIIHGRSGDYSVYDSFVNDREPSLHEPSDDEDEYSD